ncbi:YeiH family protein [Paenibacillus oleatilyticus]|uniref:YeiH family protein n=1 Tax=Paenibacillus oleatilyticus TaxID=2594886 RepID=A0ABV4V1K1_9BACL
MNGLKSLGPGLALTGVIAAVSYGLGMLFPLIGGSVFGIVIGILVNNLWRKPQNTWQGIRFCSKKVLQWAIILLGCRLSLSEVWKTGTETFAVMIVTLLLSFAAAYGFGRLLRIPPRMATLIGAGTGICGGSAIAAISPVIEAEEAEIAYSISTIFLFNIVAVLVFPALGHALGLSDAGFGLWAGTAVNDTSSVVAAGYAFSTAAGDYATIVKLTRTTMIVPIAIIMAVVVGWSKKREAAAASEGGSFSIKQVFPWFILWFLAASLLYTLGLFGEQLLHWIHLAAQFMIVVALTAVGLSADFRQMTATGVRPMILGLIVWLVVSVTGYAVGTLTGQM